VLAQIESEMTELFDFLKTVYDCFGFTYKVGLSTRNPDKFIGDIAVWDKAEAQLKSVLDRVHPNDWELNEGDGAVSRGRGFETPQLLTCNLIPQTVLRTKD
jgi:threonyl-tRNA synthetase